MIYAKDINSRQHTFEKAIGLGEEYRRSAAFLVLRSAVIKNKVVVQADVSLSTAVTFTLCRNYRSTAYGLKDLLSVLLNPLIASVMFLMVMALFIVEGQV